MGITETWPRADGSDVISGEPCPNGYRFAHLPRSLGIGGGVGMLFKSSFCTKTRISDHSFNSFEYPNQFGTIPKSSTTRALTSMLHQWLEATDGAGAAVRVVLFDYRKAFDLIDHGILIQKILSLSIPRGVAQWVINFLTSCKQRIKLSSSCNSNWELMPAGVPQGTKLGPWLFLLMINDLRIPGVPTWKYVDDTK